MAHMTEHIEGGPTSNPYATAAKYGLDGFDLLHREALRLRISRAHKVFADTEPVGTHASHLPEYETGVAPALQYRGDGRVPEDLLGAPA